MLKDFVSVYLASFKIFIQHCPISSNIDFFLVLCTLVKIYVCLFGRASEHWTSKPKVAGSIPTAVKQTFQFARCGHTQRHHHKHISSNVTRPTTLDGVGLVSTGIKSIVIKIVKRVDESKVVGFLRVLRFPPTGKVDRVG